MDQLDAGSGLLGADLALSPRNDNDRYRHMGVGSGGRVGAVLARRDLGRVSVSDPFLVIRFFAALRSLPRRRGGCGRVTAGFVRCEVASLVELHWMMGIISVLIIEQFINCLAYRWRRRRSHY
eukprot:385453-Pyramimonas_sp.AAC.1